jgi:hypothetical protein
MLCGSPIELAQKTSKKRMIDAAVAQTRRQNPDKIERR